MDGLLLHLVRATARMIYRGDLALCEQLIGELFQEGPVLRMNEEINKATVKYPQECMLCGYCELDCPEEAIYLSPVKDMPPVLSWG